MVRVLALIVVDRGFEPWSSQTKEYEIGVSCFSAKNAELRRKNKDLLAQNKDNVSEWHDMSTHGLMIQQILISLKTKLHGIKNSELAFIKI
jgi:hypothetical protein